jgi:hypothetical protein
MNDFVAFLSVALPAGALLVITAAILRALGPFNLMTLWYVPREDGWPVGVQEEDPHPWDFSASPGDPPRGPTGPTGPTRGDGPPATATALHPSTHPRSSSP